MEALLYLDLAKKTASTTVGGSRFSFPTLSYGEDVTIGVRFQERIGSTATETNRTIQEIRASIGRVDARPESGQWGFEIVSESEDIVSDLEHNVSAADLATAINALSSAEMTALGTATVTEDAGSWLITFENETVADNETPVAFIARETNSLLPISFLRHRTSQSDGKWVHELRLIQAPVASTDQSKKVLPPPPSISVVQEGGSNGEASWNEIQALFLPPDFRGVYQIRRGFQRSTMLDITDGPNEIQEAIENLADDNGEFIVTNPTTNTAHIEFSGEMGGEGQDPLEIEVFSAPEGDTTFTLDLGTAELAAVLRDVESVVLPIEIEADIEDENDDQITYTRKIYVGEVTLRRELHWEELSTSAVINWLRPPLPDRYIPYDYSQVANGQLHYAISAGDGTSAPIVVDHNLDLENLSVIVRENIAGGALLVNGTDYTVTLTNSNSLTVTPSGSVASNAWRITVLGLEMTSFFDPHTHSIAEITNLQEILDDLGERLTKIEDRTGNKPISTKITTGAISASWDLIPKFEVFPSRIDIQGSQDERLYLLDESQLGRARGLLPAIHDAVIEELTSKPPRASEEYAGRVFQYTGASRIIVAGGYGHSSAKVKTGDFLGCDGRIWYPVTRYGDHASPIAFTTDYATSDTTITAPENELSNLTRVRVSSTDALPSPLQPDTDYYVNNRADGAVELSETSGGSSIVLTDDGTGTHSLTKAEETTYYPKGFERDLFVIHVNENQLRLNTSFEVRFALEMAVLKTNTNATWTVVIEVGEKLSEESPSKTGKNISSIQWRGTPLLEQEVVLTSLSTIHRMGLQIDRRLLSDVDTLSTTALLYGGSEGGVVPPKSANFALRARLIRFDTEDGESDPRGYAAIKGFRIEDPNGSNESAVLEGRAEIK